MSLVEIILRLAVIGLLTAFLVSRYRRRLLQAPLPAEDPSVWNGQAIEARTLRPRLAQVRRDYRVVPHDSPRRADTLKQRAACARHRISGLTYFQHRRVHEDMEHPVV